MYRFYINDTLLRDQPVGWDKFKEVLKFDQSIGGIYLECPIALTFWGDGYKILQDAYDLNGYCPTQNIRIEIQNKNSNSYSEYFRGIILLTDSTRNVNKNTRECTIEDDGYFAKIHNNKSQKARLEVTKSKNGVYIDGCTAIYLEFFDPATGIYDSINTKVVYDLKDAFRFLVDYMSDGTIGFVSDWLDNLPNDEKLSIVRGIGIRSTVFVNAPSISFADLLSEVNKKYNVSFVIQRVNGSPVLRLENNDYFYNTDSVVTIDYIEDLKESFDQEKLYSVIKIGSSTSADYDSGIHSLPPIQFLSFKEEEYNVQGECNIDKTLDLVSDWVIDSNIIEDVFINANDSFDDEIFLVQYTESTSRATKGTYLTGSSPYLYNEQLLNREVAARWSVQGDIFAYLSNTNPEFKAVSIADFNLDVNNSVTTLTQSPIHFSDDYTDGNDINNVYGNGTTQGNPVSEANSRFTAVDPGYYTFELSLQGIEVTMTSQSGNDQTTSSIVELTGIRKNSAGTSLESKTVSTHLNIPPDAFTSVYTFPDALLFGFNLDATDYVITETKITVAGYGFWSVFSRYLVGSYFRCISSSTSGGSFQPTNTSYKVRLFEFSKGLSRENWDLIKLYPYKAITINHDGKTNVLTWAREIDRDTTTSMGEFKLITN